MFQVTKLYNDVLTDPDVVANPGEVNPVSCSSLSRVCAAPAVAICSFTALTGGRIHTPARQYPSQGGLGCCNLLGRRAAVFNRRR